MLIAVVLLGPAPFVLADVDPRLLDPRRASCDRMLPFVVVVVVSIAQAWALFRRA